MEATNYSYRNLLLLLTVSIACSLLTLIASIPDGVSENWVEHDSSTAVTAMEGGLEVIDDSAIESMMGNIPTRDPEYESLLALTSQGKDTKREKMTIAILDSGVRASLPRFAGYEIVSFDLTGEGPQDFNGHGSVVAALAISGISPKHVRILNIKILDRFNSTDEIKLLKGLQIAVDESALFVNVSAGVWKDLEAAKSTCYKVMRLVRSNPRTLFTFAARNDPAALDITGKVVIPAECGSAPNVVTVTGARGSKGK